MEALNYRGHLVVLMPCPGKDGAFWVSVDGIQIFIANSHGSAVRMAIIIIDDLIKPTLKDLSLIIQ